MDIIIDLLTKYGWQSVVSAVIAFLLVELLKPLARKFITKKPIRHTLYWLLSYVFSLGLTVGLAAILGRFDEWISLYGSTVIVVSILAPLISNVGFWDWIEGIVADLKVKLSDSKVWKNALKALASSFGVDTSVLDKIATMIKSEYEQYLSSDAKSFLDSNSEELVLNIKQKLAGFVDNDKLQDAAAGLFAAIKDDLVGTESADEAV